MRRSAAPSTAYPAAKKARFQPPFVSRTSPGSPVPFTISNKPNQEQAPCDDNSSSISELRSVLNAIRKPFRALHKEAVHSSSINNTTTDLQPPLSFSTTHTSNDNNLSSVPVCNTVYSKTFNPMSFEDDTDELQQAPPSETHDTCIQPSPSVHHSKSLGSKLRTVQKSPNVYQAQCNFKLERNEVQPPAGQTVSPNDESSHSKTPKTDRPKYYSVMWCKMSKKKHKTWEEDAVLTVHKTSVTLKDMEGRDIGRGTGYRISEVSGLVEGSTLIVGGKEVEILNEISDEQWNSGRCFTGASSETTSSTVSMISKAPIKMFVNPSLNGATVFKRNSTVMQPLFDPCTPDALVMPKPQPKHQLSHNRGGLQVVDVVVDPHLSHHLRPHQREGVLFLYECVMGLREFNGEGAILADEMGLGKTLQCISVLWTLLKQGPYGRNPVVKKALIVTPGSLVKNWEREFRKWLGNERLHVFAVSTENRAVEFLKTQVYPVLIISYEMFIRSQEVLGRVKFDLVICDEGHRLKNSGSKTSTMLMGFPTRRRIVLTGTPIQNDLQEFYSIVEFCNPGILDMKYIIRKGFLMFASISGSYPAFQKVYEQPIVLSQQPEATQADREVGEMRAKELRRLTSQFCIRRTQEVNKRYLPPKIESVVFCQMAPLQLSVYRHLLKSKLIRACLRRESDSSPHLECIGALRKICNSPGLILPAAKAVAEIENHLERIEGGHSETEMSLYHGVLGLFPDETIGSLTSVVENSGKLAVLSRMLHQLHSTTKEKIVVVSNFTQMLNILQSLCRDWGFQYLRLDGSTPSTKRQSLVERFNNKHSPETVFLLSSKAGGVGLNLIGASRLVLYDVDWNPANDLQAMARVWRDGQRKRVHIYRLLTTGSIEEKIYQRQISKQGLNSVVDFKNEASSSGAVKFSLEDLKDLFTVRENTVCDTHDLLDCECSAEVISPIATNTSKNPLVTELRKWKHFERPIDQTALSDELLLQASSDITFVFETETTL